MADFACGNNMVRIAAYALLVVFAAATLLTWTEVPSLRARSEPTEWFAPFGIMGSIMILLRVVAYLLPRRPSLLNLPDKKRYLKLSDDRKRHVLRHAQSLMDWLSLEVVVLGLLILFGIYHEQSFGAFNGYIIAALIFGLAASPIVSLCYVAKMQSEVSRQFRAQAADERQHAG